MCIMYRDIFRFKFFITKTSLHSVQYHSYGEVGLRDSFGLIGIRDRNEKNNNNL